MVVVASPTRSGVGAPILPAAGFGGGQALFTCILAALAGLMFGLDIGVISGALGFIAHDFGATTGQQEWIVSSMMFGAAVGALVAGWLAYRLGRKRSLVLAAVLFVIGSLLCASSQSVSMLILARVLLGLAIGVATFTAPLYLSEIAAENVRGAMISLYQLMITIGIFAAFVSDTLFGYSGDWRWMLGIIAIPGLAFLIGVLFLPDSPRWLRLRGRTEEARQVLISLRQDPAQADREIADIEEQMRIPQKGFAMFTSNPNFRRSVLLGIALQVVQQFTGMNVLMYYAPKVFGLAGFGAQASLWGTAIVGLTNVLATFIAIGLIDRWGRRPMLITSFIVMAIGMASVGTLLATGVQTHAEQLATVAMLLVFVVGFAMAAGPIIWVLCSEIQPLQGREFGIAASTFTNWVANMIVGATFLTLLTNLGQAQTFWLYAALNAIFIVFTLMFVPETKNVSLESIERNLMAGQPLRAIGR